MDLSSKRELIWRMSWTLLNLSFLKTSVFCNVMLRLKFLVVFASIAKMFQCTHFCCKTRWNSFATFMDYFLIEFLSRAGRVILYDSIHKFFILKEGLEGMFTFWDNGRMPHKLVFRNHIPEWGTRSHRISQSVLFCLTWPRCNNVPTYIFWRIMTEIN